MLPLGRTRSLSIAYRVVNVEDFVETGDVEDPQDTTLRADDIYRAVVSADSLETADEYAQTGRVKELDVFHIKDQPVSPAFDEGR